MEAILGDCGIKISVYYLKVNIEMAIQILFDHNLLENVKIVNKIANKKVYIVGSHLERVRWIRGKKGMQLIFVLMGILYII